MASTIGLAHTGSETGSEHPVWPLILHPRHRGPAAKNKAEARLAAVLPRDIEGRRLREPPSRPDAISIAATRDWLKAAGILLAAFALKGARSRAAKGFARAC
jgi:hypothetical protein